MTTYNDLDLTFIIDSDMSQKVFLDAWMDIINPTYNFNFKYKEDYATTITINQYDVANELTYSVSLYDAYPIYINQLALAWSKNDSYHKLTVTFAYTSWKNNSLQSLVQQVIDSGISSVINSVGGLGGSADKAAGTILNSLPNSVNNIKF